MLELVWVLRKGYRFRRAEIVRALKALIEAEEFEIEDEAAVHQALDAYTQGGPGFADHLILSVAGARGCRTLATLDRKLTRLDGRDRRRGPYGRRESQSRGRRHWILRHHDHDSAPS